METGPRFKVSSERPEKRGIDLATPGLVVWSVIHYAVLNQSITCIENPKFGIKLLPEIQKMSQKFSLSENLRRTRKNK